MAREVQAKPGYATGKGGKGSTTDHRGLGQGGQGRIQQIWEGRSKAREGRDRGT